MNGISALINEVPEGPLAPPPCQDTVRRYWLYQKDSPRQKPSSRTSHLQSCEEDMPAVHEPPVCGVQLQQA